MNETQAKELISQLKSMDLLGPADYLYKKDHIRSELRYGISQDDSSRIPLVTIIIPAYRRPDLFERALVSALRQECFDDYEILITDDSEEMADEYEAIVKRYGSSRVRYYKNQKSLGWYNWNRLLELARSPWVCMLHDDDILYKKHLYYMFELLKKCDNPSMLTCERIYFTHDDARLSMNEGDISRRTPGKLQLRNINFQFASFMLGAIIHREKAIQIGGFNDSIISLDYEFIARMLVNGNVYESKIATYGYGVKNNESTKSDMWEKMLISEYYLCQCISKRRGVWKGLARKVENYSLANHAQDMSHSSRNIYGVELDPYRLCGWLDIDYNIRNSGKYRLYRKLLHR